MVISTLLSFITSILLVVMFLKVAYSDQILYSVNRDPTPRQLPHKWMEAFYAITKSRADFRNNDNLNMLKTLDKLDLY